MAYQLQGNIIATDEQGYLLDHLQWEEALVPIIAEQEDIELNDAHWQIMNLGLRLAIAVIYSDYYQKVRQRWQAN